MANSNAKKSSISQVYDNLKNLDNIQTNTKNKKSSISQKYDEMISAREYGLNDFGRVNRDTTQISNKEEKVNTISKSNPYMDYDLDSMQKDYSNLYNLSQKVNSTKDKNEIASYLEGTGYSSAKELNSALSKKNAEINEIRSGQKRTKYETDAISSDDYEKYSKIGAEYKNTNYGKLFGKQLGDIKNVVTYSREHSDWLKKDMDYEDESYMYTYMTPDEVNVYNYYLAKENEGLVMPGLSSNYLKSLQSELNRRRGEELARENMDNTASELAFQMMAGAANYGSGMNDAATMISDWITGDEHEELPTSAMNYASQIVKGDLAQTGPSIFGHTLPDIAGDLLYTTGNYLPSMAFSKVAQAVFPGAGEIVGGLSVGLSAAGNEYQNMLSQGYGTDSASVDATITGFSEAMLEWLIGGIAQFGGKGLGKIVKGVTGKELKPIAQGIKNATARVWAEYGIDMLKEFNEEAMQEVLSPYIKALATGEIPEDIDWEQVIYSGILGGLNAGVLNLPNTLTTKSESAPIKNEVAIYSGNNANSNYNSNVNNNEEFSNTKTDEFTNAETNEDVIYGIDNSNNVNEEQFNDTEDFEYKEPVQEVKEEPTVNAKEELHSIISDLGFDEQTANAIELAYDEELGISPVDYATGVNVGYNYGKSGLARENIKEDSSFASLPNSVKDFAYSLGKQANATKDSARLSEIKNNANGKTGTKTGVVKGYNVKTEDLTKAFNDQQHIAYKVLSEYAKATGVDIYLYKSDTDEKGNLTSPQGKFTSKVGKDNAIYIDVTAGLPNIKDVDDLGKYVMLRTFSHEFTHFDERWNPSEYSDFRELVLAEIDRRGGDAQYLIEQEMERSGLDHDRASREVVAEAMTDMLGDERYTTEFLNNLNKKNKNLLQKLIDSLKEFIAKLKTYFKTLGSNQSEAANVLKEDIEDEIRYAQNIVDAYVKLSTGAVENFQSNYAVDEETAKTETKKETKKESKETGPKEIDVTALMNGITNAQKKANNTGEEQSVKLSDYEKKEEVTNSKETQAIIDKARKILDEAGSTNVRILLSSVEHSETPYEHYAVSLANDYGYEISINPLSLMKNTLQIHVKGAFEPIIIEGNKDWNRLTNIIRELHSKELNGAETERNNDESSDLPFMKENNAERVKRLKDYAKTLSRGGSEDTNWYKTVTDSSMYEGYLDHPDAYIKAARGYYQLGLYGEPFDYNIDNDEFWSYYFAFHEMGISLSEETAKKAYDAGIADRKALTEKAYNDEAPIHLGDNKSVFERIIEPFYHMYGASTHSKTYGKDGMKPYDLVDIAEKGNDLYVSFRDMPSKNNGREYDLKLADYKNYTAQDIIDSVDNAYGKNALGENFTQGIKDYYKKFVKTEKKTEPVKKPKKTTNTKESFSLITEDMSEAEKQAIVNAVNEEQSKNKTSSMYPTEIHEPVNAESLANEIAEKGEAEVEVVQDDYIEIVPTSSIAAKIIKGAKKNSQIVGMVSLTRPYRYYVGTNVLVAKTDKATYDSIDTDRGFDVRATTQAFDGTDKLANIKITGNVYDYPMQGKDKGYLFEDNGKQIVLNQKYVKYFAGYDLYYTGTTKAPVIVRDAKGEMVGMIMPIALKDKVDTSTLELAKIKGFNQEVKTNGNADNSGSVRKTDTDRERVSRPLNDGESEPVSGTGKGRGTVGEGTGKKSESSRNNNRPNAEGNERSGSVGSSERDVYDTTDGGTRGERGRTDESLGKPVLEEEVNTEIEEKSMTSPRGSNFTIGESLNISSSDHDKVSDNVSAIRLVKQLEKENRYATPEEQIILSKYIGWGGLADKAFGKPDLENGKVVSKPLYGWDKEFNEVKALLDEGIITQAEYDTAKSNTDTQFFTPVNVVRGMYEGLQALGFDGGRMLEPSCGVGNFVGLMPSKLSQKLKSMTMVEIDSITGLVAKYLYPNNDVRIEGFQDTDIAKNLIDVVIGNVPFAKTGVIDKNYPKSITSAIHNYIIAKSIEVTRPGGLVMVITATGTLDSMGATGIEARNYFASKADLVGAIRLPNGTFSADANTEVGSDIVIFKKREDNTAYSGEDFLNIEKKYYPSFHRDVYQNEYFSKHPDMILGDLSGFGNFGVPTYKLGDMSTLGERVTNAIKSIGAKYETNAINPVKVHNDTKVNEKKPQEGGYTVNEKGEVEVVKGGTKTKAELEQKQAEIIKGMISIYDTYSDLVNAMLEGKPDTEIARLRKSLNNLYDLFVKKFGYINNPKNRKAFESDPRAYRMTALEKYTPKTKTKDGKETPEKAEKADIFTKNTLNPITRVTHVDSIYDAVINSINTNDILDIDYMANLMKKSKKEIEQAIVKEGLGFKNKDGLYEERSKYLSGNVRAKLREAKSLAKMDKSYEVNVKELEKVIPEDIPYQKIEPQLGSSWIPNDVYAQFVSDLLGVRKDNVRITSERVRGSYGVSLMYPASGTVENKQVYGIDKMPFSEILNCIMNNETVKVMTKSGKTSVIDKESTDLANEKAKLIKSKFKEWIWNDENRRDLLTKEYNEIFNALVVPKFDGSNLTIAGLNSSYNLYDYQKDAVQRIISSGGNTYLAHTMGAGKTIMMCSAAMKLKELGIIKKPMFVVPKSKLTDWGNDFLKFYPSAKVIALPDGATSPSARKETANRIANNDWDAVIVYFEQFEALPMSEKYNIEFYERQKSEAEAEYIRARQENGNSVTTKGLATFIRGLNNRIEKLKEALKQQQDLDNINFESLGVDALFVDEAHNYKNLHFSTRMTNTTGIGNPEGADKTADMLMKVRYIQKLNGGRGIVFASGTPVTNSVSELYLIQQYLQPDVLKEMGISSFDAWVKQFADSSERFEVSPDGQTYRYHTTLKGFKNMNALQHMFRSFADVLMEIPGVDLPKIKGGNIEVVVCEPSERQLEEMRDIEVRSHKVKQGSKDDSIFSINDTGRKATYSQHVLDTSLPYEENGKIKKACRDVIATYKETSKQKGTQMIFCEYGVSDKTTKDGKEMVPVFADIKNFLIEGGIPAKEIAIINEASNDKKKEKLFDDFNEGRVRIMIGTLKKMGVGLNVQKRLCGLNFVSITQRFSDFDQAVGRAIRQGNTFSEVAVRVYVTEGMFDTLDWDKNKLKKGFVDDLLTGNEIVNSDIDDIGNEQLSLGEILSLCSGDPRLAKQAELHEEVERLNSLKRAFNNEKIANIGKYNDTLRKISRLKELIPKAEEDVAKHKNDDIENPTLTVLGKKYDDIEIAKEKLFEGLKTKNEGVDFYEVGNINGYSIGALYGLYGELRDNITIDFKITTTAKGTFKNILEASATAQQVLDGYKRSLEDLESKVDKQKELTMLEFDKEEELAEKTKQYREISVSLAGEDEFKRHEATLNKDTQYQSRDYLVNNSDYLNLADNPEANKDKLQNMVDKYAMDNGAYSKDNKKPTLFYHGSPHRKFNVFDLDYSVVGWSGIGIYLTDSKKFAEKYSRDYGTMYGLYVMSDRFATDFSHEITKDKLEKFIKENNIPEEATKILGLHFDTTNYRELLGAINSKRKISGGVDRIYDLNLGDREILLELETILKGLGNTNEETLNKLIKSFGYYGVSNSRELVVWDNTIVKSADAVTYDADGNVIPLDRRFDTDNSDIQYQSRNYSPTFYSHMAKVISGISQDKIGASSVIPYLKGKGVKDEEIKWSGIEAFLEDKKSVTKAELEEFAQGSMLQIEEKTYDTTLDNAIDLLDDKLSELGITEISASDYGDFNGEFNGEDFIYDIIEKWENKEITDEQRIQIEHFYYKLADKGREEPRYNLSRYKTEGGKHYREILFKIPNSDYKAKHWDEKGVLAHARTQDFISPNDGTMLFIEEIQSDWHNAGQSDFYEDEFVDSNMSLTDMRAEISKRQDEVDEMDYQLTQMIQNGEEDTAEYRSLNKKYKALKKSIVKLNAEESKKYFDSEIYFSTPDAPFRDGKYVEYVMKRLIRMAAEEGYDSIGWTSGKTQEERWSSEYAEGYRIEYDQDMPKFINKYGKQWGIKASKTENGNGEDIWYFEIPESMKESVLYEGQPMYQARREDTTPLTDRDVLEMASDMVDTSKFTEGEKFALETFQKRLATLHDLQTEREELGKTYKAQQFGGGDRAQATETLNRMHILDDKIKKASDDVVSVEEKEVTKSVLKKARKVVEDAERERGKAMLNRWRARKKESEAIKKYRDRIKEDVSELSEWISKPDVKKGKRIPDPIRNSVATFLSAVDFTSKRQLKGGAATKADAEFVDSLEKLKKAIQSNIDIFGADSGYADLPKDYLNDLQEFIDNVRKLTEVTNNFVINEMTGAELKELSKHIRTLKAYITQMNSFIGNAMYKHVEDAGYNSIDYLGSCGLSKNTNNFTNYIYWENVRPAFAFYERFGEGGKAIWDECVEGQAKLAFNAEKIKDFTNGNKEKGIAPAYTSKEVKEWTETLKTFDINGKKVSIPVAYIMGIYELSKQDDSLRHMLSDKGGIRIATFTQGKVKYSDEGHIISREKLDEIINSLTERQKEVADKLQQYMETVGSAWGNEISIKRFLMKLFTTPHYYPINSDGRHLATNMDEMPSNASLYALLNMSFTKDRNDEANNRIVIYSIFDVFANHMSSMAQYNAFAIPVLDSLKWFNFKEVTYTPEGEVIIGRSLKEELAKAYGVPDETRAGSGTEGYALTFIKNIIKAFNGTETQGAPTSEFGFKGLRQYNMAQIAYNGRVVVQQPMSILRAGLVIDYSSILQALKMTPADMKKNIAEMNEHNGIALWKSLGFYDVNVSRGLAELIKHSNTWLDNVNEAGMLGAEMADKITWAVMWNASKIEARKRYKVKPSNPKFFEYVNKIFNDIIYKTQVVDSVLTKTQYMRSKDFFARVMSSFMGESVTTASALTDAMFKYNMDLQRGMSKSQAWQKNKSNIGRTMLVFAISSILLAAVQGGYDALRDDDDESYGEKWLEAFIGNVIDELMPFNKLPIMSDVYDMVKQISSIWLPTYGNPPTSVWAQWFDSLYNGINIMYKKISGENTGYTWYAGIRKLLQAASGITGEPLANITREAVTFWNNTVGAFANDLKIHTYISGNPKMNTYFNAIDNGKTDKAQEIYNKLVNDKKEEIRASREDEGKTELTEAEIESKAKTSIKSSITNHYKDLYIEAYKNDNSDKMAEIRKTLYATGLYGSASDVVENCNKWLKEYK